MKNCCYLKIFFNYMLMLILNPFSIVESMPICYVRKFTKYKFLKYFLITLLWITMPFDYIWHIILLIIYGIITGIDTIIGKIILFIEDMLDMVREKIDFCVPDFSYYKSITRMILGEK